MRQLTRVRSIDFTEKAWLSSQFQVLDATRPLVHVWNNLPPNDPTASAVKTSLQLMSRAFAGIKKIIRANVLRQIAPRMMSLLDDPNAFSSRESKRLSGSKFLDTLLKQTEESDKLARL